MNIIRPPSKRKRIENLVSNSLEETVSTASGKSHSAESIRDAIRHFIDVSPTKYFNVADDRKIAGLVLAYMMEISAIGYQEVNAGGYNLIKLTAEADLQGFRESAPATFEKLQQKAMAEAGPSGQKQV